MLHYFDFEVVCMVHSHRLPFSCISSAELEGKPYLHMYKGHIACRDILELTLHAQGFMSV